MVHRKQSNGHQKQNAARTKGNSTAPVGIITAFSYSHSIFQYILGFGAENMVLL